MAQRDTKKGSVRAQGSAAKKAGKTRMAKQPGGIAISRKIPPARKKQKSAGYVLSKKTQKGAGGPSRLPLWMFSRYVRGFTSPAFF